MTSLRLLEQNQVFLAGRLTRDPDTRYTQKGEAMCRFDLAVNRNYKDKVSGEWKELVSYVPVVVWQQAAERCKEKLRKGSPVHVEGRLQSREFEDKTGQKRRVLEISARRVQFLEVAAAPAAASSAGASAAPEQASGADTDFEPANLEEVPF